MVRGFGLTNNPPAMFIGDIPHGEDLKTDFSLDGWQGSQLRSMCEGVGLNLDNFWRTLLIKEEVPNGTSEEVTNKLIENYSPILLNEINELKPNLLIPLGELSFNFLTGLTNIRKFRGSVLPTSQVLQNPFTKVLPILGAYPYLNQDYKLRQITKVDFTKISKNLDTGPIPDNKYNIWVARNAGSLRAFIERHYQKTLSGGGFLVFDIETFLQIPICLSLCFDGFESVCVPLVDSSIDKDNRALMIALVAKLLASPIKKVNQNIKYDWKILERWNFRINNVVGDTMLAASTLYCEFPKNLGFLTSIYTDLPYYKDEGKEFDPDKSRRDRYYLYNAKDSLSTSQIYAKQEEELNELGVRNVYNNLISLMPVYKKMEERGIRIDSLERDKLLCKYESLFHIQELKLKKLTGLAYFNPLSSKQCVELIFNELGYSKVQGMKTSEKGTPSTEEDSLDLLMAYGEPKRAPSTGPPVLEAIIGARKIHKVIEILNLYLHPDERFHCEFNLAGTENARTSASITTDQLFYFDEKLKIEITNLGHSLQTIGKTGFSLDGITYGQDLRNMFVPSFGYEFVECDLSQAEARVDAVLAGNYDILSVFDGPIGIHKLTGSWAYNCPPEEIKKNILVDGVDRYHVAKQMRHSYERNIQAKTLRVKFLPQLSLRECERLLKVMDAKQPEIKEVFHRDIIKALTPSKESRLTPTLICPNGRRRDFFDRIDKSTFNEAFSFLPQAIVSDQTKFKGILKTKLGHLLTEQHDGVLYEIKKGEEMKLALEYKKNVETPIDFNKCTLSRDYKLVIPCSISVGENWARMEEVKC